MGFRKDICYTLEKRWLIKLWRIKERRQIEKEDLIAKELVINDVVFDVKYLTNSTVSKEEVGLEKRIINNGKMTKGRDQIKFSFSVLGKQNYQLYDSFFENTHYTIVIPETSERFIAHSVPHSTFYQGAEVADDTEVVFKVTLTK